MTMSFVRVGVIAALISLWSTADFAQQYRQQLTTVATFFLNADTGNSNLCNNGQSMCAPGNDAVTAQQALNNPSAPFATLNAAFKTALNAYDFSGLRPVFDLAHGNYAGLAYGGNTMVSFHSVKIRGDATAPTAVSITSSKALSAIWIAHYTILQLTDVAIVDAGDSVYGIQAHEFAGIDLNGVTCQSFNSAAFCILAEGYAHIECTLPETGISSIVVGGSMGGLIDLQGKAHWNCGASAPNSAPGFATVSIPNPVSFSIAGVRSVGGGGLENMNANTFVGAGVSGTTGVRAILQGPGYMSTTLPTGGATCDQVFKYGNGSQPCQLLQGFHDDAGE
jgi:hypothetical protein